jgi:hypothetical protein
MLGAFGDDGGLEMKRSTQVKRRRTLRLDSEAFKDTIKVFWSEDSGRHGGWWMGGRSKEDDCGWRMPMKERVG